jgi:hypothetical protein
MDGVQLSKKVCRLIGEGLSVKARKILLPRQIGKEPLCLAIEILRVAERASALRYPYRSQCPRPGVYVLKQVPMNGAQVAEVEFAGRQGLGEALRGRFFLKKIQVSLGVQARAILRTVVPG